MAPYLFANKLVLDAIGKKHVNRMLKTKAKESHNFLVKYIFSDEIVKVKTIK